MLPEFMVGRTYELTELWSRCRGHNKYSVTEWFNDICIKEDWECMGNAWNVLVGLVHGNGV